MLSTFFDPQYYPMDRKTLAVNYIPKLYEEKRSESVVNYLM